MDKLINVKVDKRTELMGIMLLLSDYSKKFGKLIEECNNKEYREKIFSHFLQFKNEKAIKLLNKMINTLCFNYDAPIYLILQLDNNYGYEKLPDYPFKERLCSSQLVLEFLDEVPKFVKKTNYEKFFEDNQSFYGKGINQINNLIKDYDIVGFLKGLYKIDFKDNEFVINLMHFATRGNYGINVNNEFICNSCLRKSDNGEINFIDSLPNTLTLFVHEFSHSVINPLTDKYWNLKDDIFKDIFDKMQDMAYNNNKTIFNEHVIRAIEYIYLINNNIEGTDEYLKKFKKYHEEKGFNYIKPCIDSINNYLKNIDKYDNFEEYFPNILRDIKKYIQQPHNIKN